MVIYAVIASASVGKLFIAGLVPGVLTAVFLMIYHYFYARRRGFKPSRRASVAQLWRAFREAFLALLTPVIIMGGIFGGVFTPTEAAAITAIYALCLALFVYRTLSWRDLPRVFRDAATTSAVVGIIVSCATLANYVLARERVPQLMAETLLGLSSDPYVILTLINVLLLLLGCFMDGIAIMILTVPVLLPVVAQLGIDPTHFGIVVVMNLMIGVLTPPFGIGLFVVARVGQIPFEQLARAILPFIPVAILVLVICTYFPGLVLFLPRLAFGD
jgi:tripartite ATP-independent transporter DctM subunit